MQINGVTGSWDWPLSEYLTAFKNILTGQGEAYQYTSYRNFFANVVTMRYPTGHFFNLTFASAWLISLFLLIGLVWYSKSRLEKRRYKGMFITLTVFVAAYLFYLLTLYLCLMSEPEALRSASFERYSATIACYPFHGSVSGAVPSTLIIRQRRDGWPLAAKGCWSVWRFCW